MTDFKKTQKKAIELDRLNEAYKYCMEDEKSIEYTIQYMQDVCNVDLDRVIKYLTLNGGFSEDNPNGITATYQTEDVEIFTSHKYIENKVKNLLQ
jgi:hypothetical protein